MYDALVCAVQWQLQTCCQYETLVVISDNLRELGFVLVEIKYGMVY